MIDPQCLEHPRPEGAESTLARTPVVHFIQADQDKTATKNAKRVERKLGANPVSRGSICGSIYWPVLKNMLLSIPSIPRNSLITKHVATFTRWKS
jgi:hypothetical protein